MTNNVKKVLDVYDYVKHTNVELYFGYKGESYFVDWRDNKILECRSINHTIAIFSGYDELMNNLVLGDKPFKSILSKLDFFEAV